MDINDIHWGDCRVLGQHIKPESVDFILCDPVYNQVWQYKWLADFAGRVLRPGASVVAQCGHIYRFQAETVMQDERLVKRPLITEVFTGGFKSIWMHRAHRASNPWIWLEKEPRTRTTWIPTMFFGKKDKTRHRWGDGLRAALFFIAKFTQPGDLVIDPFTGSGTVPAACKMLGRNYIAFEIDVDTAEDAWNRLKNETKIPLFNIEQLTLLEAA